MVEHYTYYVYNSRTNETAYESDQKDECLNWAYKHYEKNHEDAEHLQLVTVYPRSE